MKIQIESTSKVVELAVDGGPGCIKARVWEGITERGTPVFCFIPRIAPAIPEPELSPAVLEEFGRDLQETRTPSPAVQSIDLRLIL